MRKSFKAAVSAVASAAMVASLLATPISAYAASGTGNSVSSSTSWTTPTEYMDNTVSVDVDNDGTDETAKVITTWANAWALSGPDYLGVSNSGTLNQNGGAASSANYTTMKSSELVGIWASSVNEVPNAYNWNYFYNCYLTEQGEDTDDTLAAIDISNGSDIGFSSRAGVWGCFVYRPEVIWCSNSLTSDQAYQYSELIRNGQYYTIGNTGTVTSGSYSAAGNISAFETGVTYCTATSNSDGTMTYTELLTEPDSGTTYYTGEDTDGDDMIDTYTACEELLKFEDGVTYYVQDEATYTACEGLTEFESGVTYYTATTTTSGGGGMGGGMGGGSSTSTTTYTEVESGTDFDSSVTYYTMDDPTYTEVTVSYFDSNETYYILSSSGYYVADSSGNVYPAESDTTDYYIAGDEDYDPYVVSGGSGALGKSANLSGSSATPGSGGVWCILDSLYDLAGYCEEIISTYSGNDDTSVTSVTWQTMNSLPRTTRYEASSENAVSAEEACLDMEKVMRGAFWYTMAATDSTSSVYDSSVLTGQKTVAVVSGSLDTASSTVTLSSSDTIPAMNAGADSGKFNACYLVTEQPTDSDGNYITSASADELLACDVIWAANGSASVSDWQSWLSENATSSELKAKASTISIITDVPAIMNAHNWTMEKTVCVLYSLNFIYPELFPELELVTYWYDNVYHVKSNYLTTSLAYGLGSCTLPSDVSSLADLPGSSYSSTDIDNKAKLGYEYYASTYASASDFSTENPNDELVASDAMKTWASSYTVQEVSTTTTTTTTANVTVSTDDSGNVSVSGTDATTYAAAITKVVATYTDSDGNTSSIVLSYDEDGNIDTSTLEAGVTYTVTISASGYEDVVTTLTTDDSGTVTTVEVTSGTTSTTTTTGSGSTASGSGSGTSTSVANSVKVTTKTASVKGKYKKNKLKKTMKVAASKCFKITGNKGGKVTYSPSKLTIKKGTKKGKTVSFKVTVKIAAKGTVKAYSKKFTVKVKLK